MFCCPQTFQSLPEIINCRKRMILNIDIRMPLQRLFLHIRTHYVIFNRDTKLENDIPSAMFSRATPFCLVLSFLSSEFYDCFVGKLKNKENKKEMKKEKSKKNNIEMERTNENWDIWNRTMVSLPGSCFHFFNFSFFVSSGLVLSQAQAHEIEDGI